MLDGISGSVGSSPVRGKLRLSLGVSNDGIPTVRLMDSGSHSRELLGVDGEGEPALDFYAQDGTVLRELP